MSFTPTIPEDFDAFWAETVAQAKAQPLDFHRSNSRDFAHPSHVVERMDFQGMGERRLHGWIAYPSGIRRAPAFLWLAPYGLQSQLPDEFGTREGYVSLSFNFHGFDAFYREEYSPERGYFALGVEEPESWIFRTMFQDSVIAMRVLQAQIEADEDQLCACGMSQGGGISIWLGAHLPMVKAICADMPFLCNIGDTISRPIHRYPPKELTDFADTIPLGMERIRHTVSYYDTVVHATRCGVPTQVSLGLKDPACTPQNVEAAYANLAGTKALIKYEGGHDWDPAMVSNNKNWLERNL